MEKIKIEKEAIFIIIMEIIMSIFSMITAFKSHNSTWILCSVLWLDLAVTNYINNKMLTLKNKMIAVQHSIIEHCNKIINEYEQIEVKKEDE